MQLFEDKRQHVRIEGVDDGDDRMRAFRARVIGERRLEREVHFIDRTAGGNDPIRLGQFVSVVITDRRLTQRVVDRIASPAKRRIILRGDLAQYGAAGGAQPLFAQEAWTVPQKIARRQKHADRRIDQFRQFAHRRAVKRHGAACGQDNVAIAQMAARPLQPGFGFLVRHAGAFQSSLGNSGRWKFTKIQPSLA